MHHRNNINNRIRKPKPARRIVLTFVLIIFVGSLLLALPSATATGKPVAYIDALFTSTSSVCVVGLILFTTASHWSSFGKFVIFILMQVGGLGIMTVVTMVIILSRKKITLSQRLIIRDAFNQEGPQGMVKLVLYIMKFTIAVEAIGALLLALRFSFDFPFYEAVYKGIFHAVSAYCNAGIDTFGDTSLFLYRGDLTVNLVIIFLVTVGGLGFPVLMDLRTGYNKVFKERKSLKRTFNSLELHTKLVLTISFLLLTISAIIFFVAEMNNPRTMAHLSLKDKILASVFQSASMRTAGFSTINQSDFTYSSKILSMVLMFIGGSPSGTSGGVKTVTLGVLVAAVHSLVSGRNSVRAFGRKISYYMVQKALAVFFLGQVTVIVATMLLSFTEGNYAFTFLDILFESIAAFSTTGVTLGLTPELSFFGKVILIVVMFIGRLGPISVAATITIIHSHAKSQFDYPEGRIIIG